MRVLVGDVEMAARYVRLTAADDLVAAISGRVAELPEEFRGDAERAWRRVLTISARAGDRSGGLVVAGEDARSPD